MAKTAYLLIIAILSVIGSVTTTTAQQPAPAREQKTPAARPDQKRTDKAARTDKELRTDKEPRSIKGRVTDEGGQPVDDATVYVIPAGTFSAKSPLDGLKIRPASTDNDGKFELDGVGSGLYSLMALAPGYVTVAGLSIDGGVQKYYRPGEFVSVKLVKGGVITGTVTNDAGEPMVATRMRAVRVRDAEGRPARVRAIDPMQWMQEWKTDDRGHYRIYGLEPGSYLVSAGGKALLSFQDEVQTGDVTTYYPSSTRDTASEVKVTGGQEAIGVDIRYRSSPGYGISGTIAGAADVGRESATIITLSHASSGSTEAMTFVLMAMPNRSFSFYGVADGEYYLSAICSGEKETAAVSSPRRIKVRGADVTGIEMTLVPLSSIAGRVVVAPLDATRAPECKPARKTAIEEIVLLARRDAKGDRPRAVSPLEFMLFSVDSVPNDKGEFTIGNLESARYHMETRLPGDALYVRSITTANEAQNQPAATTQNGIQLKQGQRLTGLTITVAEGAAGLSGKITASNKDQQLPARVRAHLVPAEPEAAIDALRYREAMAESDGAFAFSNVAPGRYLILAREVLDSEMSEDGPRPIAWDEKAREALRREAETSGVIVELQPCRRATDYALRFSPATKQTAK
jgi:hypothetical protein